jgi:hypothetical protein
MDFGIALGQKALDVARTLLRHVPSSVPFSVPSSVLICRRRADCPHPPIGLFKCFGVAPLRLADAIRLGLANLPRPVVQMRGIWIAVPTSLTASVANSKMCLPDCHGTPPLFSLFPYCHSSVVSSSAAFLFLCRPPLPHSTSVNFPLLLPARSAAAV